MSNPKDLLTIGQISGNCRVSVKTLRHYDEIDLVKPVYVNPANQYRVCNKSCRDIYGVFIIPKV